MAISDRARQRWLSAGLLALACTAAIATVGPAQAQGTKNTATKTDTRSETKAATKTTAKPAGSSASTPAAGFTIAMPPAWVQPLVAEATPGLPTAALQVLLIDRQTRVDRTTGTWRYQHLIRQINETAGLQNGAQIELEFDPSYQKLVLHQLALWREGKRIDKLNPKSVKLLHRETQLERQMVDGRMTASIVLEDLRVGDRVEWAASLVGDNPVFSGKHVDQEWTSASTGPVGRVQLRLLAPAERQILHREASGLGIEVSESESQGWRETVWRRRNVAQFHYDPLTPAADYQLDQVQISEFADWAEVAQWAQQLFAKTGNGDKGREALAPEIEALKAQALAAGDKPEERLRLALDFAQQKVRYFGTEMGANSHQPATVDQVLRQRFGDCKDKAALLVALLAGLDIQASPVLVSTQSRGDLKGRLPSPLAFDHVITAVQLDGQTLWLDATRSMQRGTPTTRQSAGLDLGLLARADAKELSALPLPGEALRSETLDTFLFPKLAEPGRFDSVTTYHGDLAEWIRAAQANLPAEEFKKQLIGETLRVYPSFSLEGEPVLEEVDGRNAIRLSLHFRIGDDYWRMPDKRSMSGEFALLDLILPLRLPDQTPRTQAMLINLPGRYLQKVRFEFGEDVFQQVSSSRFDESNDIFQLHLRYAGDTRWQQVDGELRLQAETIPAGRWSKHRDTLNKVWQRLGATLYMTPMSPDQLAQARKAVNELGEQMMRGKISVRTAEQSAAQARLLLIEHQLKADRLPLKLRAQVLADRGAQLDLLGQLEAGRQAFEQAQRLSPDDADISAGMAVNALMRGQYVEAASLSSRSLQLAPNNTQSRYTRAWAHYFAGELGNARSELSEILQSSTEVERSYGSIWLYLAARRQGEDGATAAKSLPMPSDSQPAWPFAVLQLMQGKLDFKAALDASREAGKPNPSRECELYFYAAQKALADQDLNLARSYLRKSLDTGVTEFNEYAMAARELERISAR